MPVLLTFEILWLDCAPYWSTENHGARVIGRDYVKRRDLHAAIVAASNMLRSGKGNSDYARGFVVRVCRSQDGVYLDPREV